MANLYLAARWSRKQEIDDLIPVFERAGHRVVSTWTKEIGDGTESHDYYPHEYQREAGYRDIVELDAADTFVLFGEPSGSSNPGGGRFVELGYCLARGIPIVTIGESECIFQSLDSVRIVGSVREALNIL